MHVDVVEDEAAAVDVDDDRVPWHAGGRVQPGWYAVGVDVRDLRDLLPRLLRRDPPSVGAGRNDVVPSLQTGVWAA